MSLRDRLSKLEGVAVNADHLLVIKESMVRAATLASQNRRQISALNEQLDDAFLPAVQSQSPPSLDGWRYPSHLLIQAQAIAGRRREL